MSATLVALAWPTSRLGEATLELARAAGLPILEGARPTEPREAAPPLAWIALAARELGLEAEPIEGAHRELEAVLDGVAPALVPLRGESEDVVGVLALLAGGRHARVLTPDGAVRRVGRAALVEALSAPLVRALRTRGLGAMLEEAGVPARRRAVALRAMASAGRYGEVPCGPFVTLRVPPSASLWIAARREGATRAGLVLLTAHGARLVASLLAWYLLGRGALGGTLELGWLLAWVLALATTVPTNAVSSWAQGRFGITVGRLLEERLLTGATRLPADAIRREGVGGLLARVLEASRFRTLVVDGGLAAALSLLDLAFAGWVLAQGAGGALHVLAYLGYVALIVLVVVTLVARLRAWTRQRLAMTHDLVERMVGHRTRLIQEPASRWHEEEDAHVEAYLGRSRALDRAAIGLSVLPRGWMFVGGLALAPAVVAGADATSLAVAVGGVLLAGQALGALGGGLEQLAHAAVALAPLRPLLEAASREEPRGALDVPLAETPRDPERPVLEARELGYRYPERAEPVLRACTLRLSPGDRVLLAGASGSGKSTLTALLGGLRAPTHGLTLVDGLDWRSLGAEAWRARVVTVPQFHENHVLSASFEFNGLMGRSWPPEPGDREELREVCDALGLGPMLDRMPAGFEQMVGEHGWQLSHGERSRLYLARALLQRRARVWILDESFAALDPINLERCLRLVLERAPSLVVVAHP